jgi:outer membrane biosynthesis protein TonB
MKPLLLAVASVGLLGIALAPSAQADAWNKLTYLTVNQPIQVPNKVLPPGKYTMMLLDSPGDRHVVQIFNADQTHLETTVMAIPNYRLQPTGKTVFTFWETPPGQPKALRAWFYPGDNFGQEFVYPKSFATQIASISHEQVPTSTAKQEEQAAVTPAPAPAPEQQPQQEIAQATPPPPAAAPAPEPAPQPAPPQELPKTASPYPFIGLAGLLSFGMCAMVRVIRLS